MDTLATVKEIMALIENNDSRWLTLVTSCSNQEIYNNWYSNIPSEFTELDVTLINFENERVILYVL